MVQSSLVPTVRRARTAWVWLPALILAATAGCSHRRTSMRPVYIGPATTVPASPCAGANCPPETAPTTTIESSPIESEVPSLPSTITSSPASAADTPPPITAPRLSDEPAYSDPKGGTPSKATPSSKTKRSNSDLDSGASNFKGSGTSSPSASVRSTNSRRAPAPSRLHQASLVEELKPYVNDPDDLFAPPKADRPWKYIVLHHSASAEGSYDTIDAEHRKRLGWAGCGYHFIIGNGSESPDGAIEVAQRWTNQKHGVHCRDGKHPDVNEYGIGICLVGDLEKSPPTEKQIAAARALVAYLSDRYHIAADHTDSHSHLAASPTSCPGRHFPSEEILTARGVTLR